VIVHHSAAAEAAAEFADEYFDWIYIDGNHQYEFVLLDLESYYPKVKAGGSIVGDDYGVEGWWRGGVTRAVRW
jgi:cephalosporin hydroxylase